MNLKELQSKIYSAAAQKDILEKQVGALSIDIERSEKRLSNIELAQALLQKVAQETQEQLVFQLEETVNPALETCFPGQYRFRVDVEIKRNKTEAKLVFTKNGFEIDPLSASGGGVVDVAAFALRIASWAISSTANTLIIDEGFRFLSRKLQPLAAQIMQEVSQKLGIQFIQVSHSPDIIESSDRVFTVALNSEQVSEVTMQSAF